MFTQKFIGTLQGKDIIKQKSGIHIINSSGTIIQYQLLDNFNKKEIAFIEEQLLKACFFTKKSIAELKLPTLKSLETATDAFLRYDNDAITVILKKLSEIYDVLLNKMAFKRKSVCEDKKQTLDYVYISTNPDTHSTTVYDKFFEHDEYFERIFTRSSLLIHEASHLTGLREEAHKRDPVREDSPFPRPNLCHTQLKYKNEYNYGGGLINDFTPKNTPIYSGTLKIK